MKTTLHCFSLCSVRSFPSIRGKAEIEMEGDRGEFEMERNGLFRFYQRNWRREQDKTGLLWLFDIFCIFSKSGIIIRGKICELIRSQPMFEFSYFHSKEKKAHLYEDINSNSDVIWNDDRRLQNCHAIVTSFFWTASKSQIAIYPVCDISSHLARGNHRIGREPMQNKEGFTSPRAEIQI